jgi:hypothetical protein
MLLLLKLMLTGFILLIKQNTTVRPIFLSLSITRSKFLATSNHFLLFAAKIVISNRQTLESLRFEEYIPLSRKCKPYIYCSQLNTQSSYYYFL